ncbi:cell division initiation protein [Streptomyces tateyamensis]|uniref:Cell division initiation protein n=1 Tax=Streptomyces tateyamensis TaxID=565073 RepID=A0A2V4N4Q8_9ACTN|nr:cell division initiation protein [Streptomyces tateyamensis]PYC79125.1 cell division initiation protein [Streptomyces tateyamensis]
MDVQNRVDEIIAVVENARAMPMSASCVVNRAELVALLRDLREALPAELAQAQSVVADHEQMVAGARDEAERIIQGAHAERGSLISDTEVAHRAKAEADRILAEARSEVQAKREEADDYVDSKLANFEVVLTKTLGAVGRGRDKLRGEGNYEAEDGEEFQPHASPSPEVDEYVDAKLATLQAVLSGTLEAVGRGRDKLLGKKPVDELAAYLAAADEAQQLRDRAEAVAAGFSDEEERPWYREEEQAWPEQTPVQAGWQAAPGEAAYVQGYQQSQEYQQQPVAYQDAYGGGYDQGTGQYAVHPGYEGYPQPQQADPYAAGYSYPQEQQHGYQPVPQQAEYQQQDYGYQQHAAPQQHAPQPALDETSFFDTSMIDMTRLRELGGR